MSIRTLTVASALDCDTPGCGSTWFDNSHPDLASSLRQAERDDWTVVGKEHFCPECSARRAGRAYYPRSPHYRAVQLHDVGQEGPSWDTYDNTGGRLGTELRRTHTP